MARKLPSSADLGERPDVTPGGGVASYGVPSGGAAARGMINAGARLASAGDDFHRLVKQEEERVNTTRAEEAFNKLRERQLDLTIGEQNGFAHKRGADAINQPLLKDYSDRLDNVTRELEGELANDNQRQLFRKRASVSGLQFREDLLRHIRSEGDVHAKQVFEGGVTVETRNATARWQDSAAVALSLERVSGLIDQEAARGGWAPEAIAAEKLKRSSQIHSAVIGQALATDNYVFAQQWYEQNKEQIDPTTAKAVLKAVEDGTQKQTYATYTRDYLGVQDDRKGLASLHAKVLADPLLDDTRKNALLGRIQARDGVLENRATVAAGKIEARLKRSIEEVRGNLLAGFEPTAEQLAPLLNATKGSELEGEVRTLIAGSNATRTFRNSLPAAQEQMLAQAESAIRQDPTKFDRRILESWRTIHENQKRRVAESPITFAVQQGLIDPQSPAARPLDLSNPNAAAEGIAARFELSRALARAYNAPEKPLTAEEASLAAATLRGATVTQKREWFGALAQATNGDAHGYSAILAQIAPDAPVTAIAGEYAGKGRNTAADLMLRGEAILRPNRKEDGSPDGGKLLPMPSPTEMRRIFDDTVREAYSGMPTARADHFQAARAIYAALSSDAGDRDTGMLDSDRWKQAIQMATGGIQKYQGRNIVMPYGFENSQFRDGLARRVEDIVEGGRLGPEWTKQRLLSLPLQPVGDGRYAFVVGDSLLAQRERQDFGRRPDGSPKGAGFLGVLKRPDGDVSTEVSIGIEINGKEMDIPTLVPTLTSAEVQQVLNLKENQKIPEAIIDKAVAHARKRMQEGKPVFATPDESPDQGVMRPLIIDFETSVPFRTSGHGLRAVAQEPTAAELQEAQKPATGRTLARKRPPVVAQPADEPVRATPPIIGVRG
jgi:hypothetical protein